MIIISRSTEKSNRLSFLSSKNDQILSMMAKKLKMEKIFPLFPVDCFFSFLFVEEIFLIFFQGFSVQG